MHGQQHIKKPLAGLDVHSTLYEYEDGDSKHREV